MRPEPRSLYAHLCSSAFLIIGADHFIGGGSQEAPRAKSPAQGAVPSHNQPGADSCVSRSVCQFFVMLFVVFSENNSRSQPEQRDVALAWAVKRGIDKLNRGSNL
jgi:hypothetical protein